MAKMKAYASFDDYLEDQSVKNKEIIHALRRFVKRAEPGLREAVKWGQGCWIGTNGPVVYVHSETGYVQFGFFNGASLRDPKQLLEGKGSYVRHIKVHDASGIDRRAFAALLKEAAGSRSTRSGLRTQGSANPPGWPRLLWRHSSRASHRTVLSANCRFCMPGTE